MITMYEVMKSINNFFTNADKLEYGDWEIVNGKLNLPFLRTGQYFLTEGSDFNDNKIHLYTNGKENLTDEKFTGYIVPLYVPAEFVDLCTRISEYMAKNSKGESAYISESFGGYSYSKGTHTDGTPWSWKDVFKQELNQWRKL